MKKTLQLFSIALFTFVFASAQDFTVDDISYNIIDATNVAVQGSTLAELNIPATVDNEGTTYTVSSFVGGSFRDNLTVTSVTLPPSITVLAANTFRGANNITSIDLEDIVTIESSNTISRINNLNSVELPSATFIGNFAFVQSFQLSSVKIPVAETIGVGAFRQTAIASIDIPSSVHTIGESVFQATNTLSAVKVNWTSADDVPAITTNVFDGLIASDITLYVPTGTSSIYSSLAVWNTLTIVEGDIPSKIVGQIFTDGDYDYTISSLSPKTVEVSGLSNVALTTLNIPSTATDEDSDVYEVIAVANSAFMSNTTITSVELPSSVKTISENAFRLCTALTYLDTEDVTTIEPNILRESINITTLDLGEVTSIGINGLARAYGMTGIIDLPKIETLGAYAFVFTQGVTEINLGAALTSTDQNTFFGLPSLTLIRVEAETPPATTGVFIPGTGSDRSTDDQSALDLTTVVLQVPNEAAITAYESALGWQDFATTELLSIEDILTGILDIQVNSNSIIVNSSSVFKNGNVSVYDITGRLLTSEVLNGASASVNISGLISGIYILKITEGNAKLVKRFAKQ